MSGGARNADRPAPGAPATRAVVIVPARLGSQRLPRKMLLDRTGACLFEHTARNAARAPSVRRVLVATDSEEIAARARQAGLEVQLTRADHQSGTDRVHEAFARTRPPCDVVVNVQGDEPELDPRDLEDLVRAFADPAVEVATLAGPLSEGDAERPQVVKVVRDARGDALYFSRAPIPYRAASASGAAAATAVASGGTPGAGAAAPAYARADALPWSQLARRHIGVYAFRPPALERYCGLQRGRLEALENLEQLRWLEAGHRMRVVEARSVPLGIDTADDYHAFVERVRLHSATGTHAGGAGDATPGTRRGSSRGQR